MGDLPLFRKPRPIDSAYHANAEIVLFSGDMSEFIAQLPDQSVSDDMSTGVSYFEQFVWDLQHRGIADIDIPVLILGVIA
jgi:hypothetical protein